MDLRLGEALGVLRTLEAGSVDALVTDPPAGIGFMGKEWDDFRRQRNEADAGRGNVFGRTSAKAPEYARRSRAAFVDSLAVIFEECIRVLKPGAHGLVWAIPRTSHWTATALEDSGFEIRDVGVHLFGTGFPKSLDVSKAIDKAAGERRGRPPDRRNGPNTDAGTKGNKYSGGYTQTAPEDGGPVTPDATRWFGWGTALKPAAEHWILVRKPLDGTVAANVQKHGTGALNIDGCRIEGLKEVPGSANGKGGKSIAMAGALGPKNATMGGHNPNIGRWPANLTLCACAAALLDEQSGELSSGTMRDTPRANREGWAGPMPAIALGHTGDSGGASRFFYVAKPDRSERDIGCDGLPAASGGTATDRQDGSAGLQNPRAGAGRNGGARNIHPTVKPVNLMRWLCRLVTPKGGLVLDPFMGSGTTGVACAREGFRFIGIERESQYMEIAMRRIHGDAPLFNQPTQTRLLP